MSFGNSGEMDWLISCNGPTVLVQSLDDTSLTMTGLSPVGVAGAV